jgi:hypothetical protein
MSASSWFTTPGASGSSSVSASSSFLTGTWGSLFPDSYHHHQFHPWLLSSSWAKSSAWKTTGKIVKKCLY